MVFTMQFFVFPKSLFAATVSATTIPTAILLSWERSATPVPPETIASWFWPVTTVGYGNTMQTEALSPQSCQWEKFFCQAFLSESTRYSIHSRTAFAFDEATARTFLNELRESTRTEPIDATFALDENGTVSTFAPSRNGSEIDVDATLDILTRLILLSHETSLSMTVPSKVLTPAVTSTDADRLGITTFLGEGRTNFAGSPKNRIFNIKRAIEQFQGVLIKPGEDFSFVEYLGPVDAEHGYLPELVIKRGRTEPEFGGGICQVSTTLFRAALNTGQKITERRNHAYPVSYYKPYGMDATIYIPKPDFRFINNTPAYILIQVAIEGSELVFRFYGTSDGRSVSIDGPFITARTPDGGMKTTFTQTVTAQDGSTLIEDIFKSSYESASKYPHPGEEKFTEKPKNWSEKQWDAYVKTGTLPR